MNKRMADLADIIVRYSLLILVGVIGLNFFYILFTSMTIYPTFFLLNLFFDASIVSNIILVNSTPIEIIGSCIGGSAYYLLLILNLSIGRLTAKKRTVMLLFSFGAFLFINIMRLFILSVMYVNGVSSFDLTHKLFWYLGSVFFVVGIWFLTVKVFHIKEIPLYSDVDFLLKLGKKPKKSKSSKKH